MTQESNNNATLEWPAKYNEVPKEVFERADLWPLELEKIFYGDEWHPIVHQSEIPNIGDFKSVEIIEVLVKNGEEIKKGDPLITLESDKSSVEVPSPLSGKILNINVKIGDKVSEGDTVLEIDSANNKVEAKPEINNEKIMYFNFTLDFFSI